MSRPRRQRNPSDLVEDALIERCAEELAQTTKDYFREHSIDPDQWTPEQFNEFLSGLAMKAFERRTQLKRGKNLGL